MKSVKPIVLLSFLFFASVIADDYSEPISSNNDLTVFDENEDLVNDDGADEDYNSDENEDIVYTNMISKKTPSPPPPVKFPSSSTLIKSPHPSSSYNFPSSSFTPPTCKKWRCKLNGYVPIWTSSVTDFCKDNYSKLGWQQKANCQDQFCVKVCEKF